MATVAPDVAARGDRGVPARGPGGARPAPAGTDPSRPAAARGPRPDPVHRPRDQTAVHPVQPDLAQHRPRTELVPMATPAPGPRPLVPPPRPATRPGDIPMIKSQSTAAVQTAEGE